MLFLRIITFNLLLLPFISLAQNDMPFINERYVGTFASVGIPYYELPEGETYQPLLVGFTYHLPFYQTKGKFNIGVDIMPHLGVAKFEKTAHEAGVNVQFNFNYALSVRDIISVRGGAGPHYVTVQTAKQASGYIFSDNIALSYRRKIQDYNVGIFVGIRHISNAGLQQPNDGIDNIMLSLEFAWLLGK